MKRTLVPVLAFIACLSASLAPAAEPRVSKFTRYDAGEFVIVSSRSGKQARDFMEQLAMFRATLERTLGKRATKNTTPTTILIASNADWRTWLQPRDNVAGFFQRGRFANYLALNGDWSQQETLHIVFHEYSHYYLATQFAGEYPPWFNEGLAELMGYAKFEKGSAILMIPMVLVLEARDGDWIPFERLIRVKQSDPEYRSHKLGPSFYAQSWLTIHYGLVENREFGRQIFDYLGQINSLVPHEEAARKAFGDLAAVDGQLREYSRNKRMNSGAINLGELPPVTIAEGVPMSDPDVYETLADVMIEIRNPPARVQPLVDAMQKREPNAARPHILAARLAVLANDPKALEKAVGKAEAALAPDDWLQRRELASVLLSTSDNVDDPKGTSGAETVDRHLARAMKWFAEAIQHNNADVEALWGFGTAATRLDKNLDLAEQALVSAYQRDPSNADIAMSLANLKAAQQKPEEMIPFLEDVIRWSTNLGMRSWAASTLTQTKEYIAERDRVDAENRRQREEYEKQLAEYEKKYGKSKTRK